MSVVAKPWMHALTKTKPRVAAVAGSLGFTSATLRERVPGFGGGGMFSSPLLVLGGLGLAAVLVTQSNVLDNIGGS